MRNRYAVHTVLGVVVATERLHSGNWCARVYDVYDPQAPIVFAKTEQRALEDMAHSLLAQNWVSLEHRDPLVFE